MENLEEILTDEEREALRFEQGGFNLRDVAARAEDVFFMTMEDDPEACLMGGGLLMAGQPG